MCKQQTKQSASDGVYRDVSRRRGVRCLEVRVGASRRHRRRLHHPGVLATKVGYVGVKSAKVLLEQMGT